MHWKLLKWLTSLCVFYCDKNIHKRKRKSRPGLTNRTGVSCAHATRTPTLVRPLDTQQWEEPGDWGPLSSLGQAWVLFFLPYRYIKKTKWCRCGESPLCAGAELHIRPAATLSHIWGQLSRPTRCTATCSWWMGTCMETPPASSARVAHEWANWEVPNSAQNGGLF